MRVTYRVNEVFRSRQGEGHRVGTDNVFVRFTGCNLRCAQEPGPRSPGGFDCDTEFASGRVMTLLELLDLVIQTAAGPSPFPEDEGEPAGWVILTGGEPMLQADWRLAKALQEARFRIAVETNGSVPVPALLYDYVAVSPKVAEHALRVKKADEVRYVRGYGQGLPKPRIVADHYFVSPAFIGDQPDPRAVEWCDELVRGNDKWRVSVQMHKVWRVR